MEFTTLAADAEDETVYPYYVITMGADATEAAAGNYHIYKKANSTGSFAAFTTSSADVGTAYSIIGNAITAVTTDVTSGSSATLRFGLTGTDVSATGTLDIGTEIVVLGSSGSYTIKGSLTGSSHYVIELSGASVEVSGGTVSASGGIAIYSNGSGDIIVSGGIVSSSDGSAIYSDYGSGDIIVSGGTVSASNGNAICSYGSGNIIVSGGTVTCSAEEYGYAICNFSTGSVTVSSGKVKSTNTTAIRNEGGNIVVSGGTVESTHDDAIVNGNSGNITVSGDGLVTSGNEGGSAIYDNFGSSGDITVSGGTLTSSNGKTIYKCGSGDITIIDGTLQNAGSDYNVIYCEDDSSGSITISGGALTNSGSDDSGNVIYIHGDSNVSVTITGGTLENTGEGRGIESCNSKDIHVSDGKVYSAEGNAIYCDNDTADVYISGDEWNEDTKTGTLIKSEATDAFTLSCADALYMTGGTIIGGACGGGTHISGGRIETTNRAALLLSSSTSYISGGTIISANTTEPSADAFGSHLYPGTIFISDADTDDAKLYISGGTITNTAEGCPAIFNLGIRDVDPDYSDYTSEIFLSGTPSISGDADIWTNTAIHANNGDSENTDPYTGDALTLEYGGTITSGTTAAVTGATDENYSLFSITNLGYFLSQDSGNLLINAITDKWLDVASFYSTDWYTENPNATSFTISTAADLAGLAYLVNSGADTFSGDTITLANNINIGTHEWVPIGKTTSVFSGNFDGNHKSISGLYISELNSNYQGLFGYIDGGTVKDLSLTGAVSGMSYIGAVSGFTKNASIQNCVNSCTVYGRGNYCGGIAGFINYATLNSCINLGAVSSLISCTGGVAGYSSIADIINCSNKGAVSANSSAGGIAGFSYSMANCYNSGSVTVTGNNAGGIVGYNMGAVENCYNYGSVSGTASGGVIGESYSSGAVTMITGCYWLTGTAANCVSVSSGSGSAISSCGTFTSAGAITAGTAGNCGSIQTLLYGNALLAALDKWVTLTNGTNYLEWAAPSGSVNSGYPVFGVPHTQRVITGQPSADNLFTVSATDVTGIEKSYQWYEFTAGSDAAELNLTFGTAGWDVLGTVSPNGFGLTDTSGYYENGHSTWTHSDDGLYTSGGHGTDAVQGKCYSAMMIPVTVTGNDELSFEWKVSSESACDYLSVGLLKNSGGSYALVSGTSVESISGEVGWTFKNFTGLDAGTYYLVFVYTKDLGADIGSDRGYVRLVGTNKQLAGNIGAQLNLTGLTAGQMFRCKASYSDGVLLISDNTTFVPVFTITNNFSGITTSNSVTSAVINSSYSATLVPASSGYSMSVTVTMGGTDVTSSAYNSSTKTVSIENVTGDIVITATASAPSDSGGSYTPTRTIDVTETSSSLFSGSEGQIKAEANMNSAFSNSVEVKVTDTEQDDSGFGLGAWNDVYPFDISLYIKGTNTKAEPKDGYGVTISLPVPDKLLDVKEQLSILHKSDNGTVTTLKSQLKQISGVWYLVFEATEFSPYALVVKKTAAYDESAGLPYYLNSDGKAVFIGFAANGKYIAPSGATVLFRKNAMSFTDIGSHWAKDYIGFVTERELFTGTGENRFEPDTGMTRTMFATVIGRLYERSYGEIEALSDHAFTDCDYNDYYGKYVDWAVEEGIIGGYGNGKFGPDDQITREQMAAILYRFAEYLGILSDSIDTVLSYPDAGAISDWAQSASLYCQSTGVITGRDGGSFMPQGTATRAEVAAVIQRFINTAVD